MPSATELELKRAINGYVLGRIRAEALPAVAVQALIDGHDSPSIRRLAAGEGLSNEVLRVLLSQALDELGFTFPSLVNASLAEARLIAQDVLNGGITPYAGAKRIWSELNTQSHELARLKPFVGLASEYEDDEKNRDKYTQMIVEECKAFLSENM